MYKIDHPIYKSFCDDAMVLPEDWHTILNFKWIIYGLIGDLLETANLEVYFKLLEMFQTLNQEKANGNHTQLITEQCFVDYPQIAYFFSACSGIPVYGNYILTKPTTFKGISWIDNYRYDLISTELPELVQSYLDFNICADDKGDVCAEEVKGIFDCEGIPDTVYDDDEADNDSETIGLDYVFLANNHFKKELENYLSLNNRGNRLCLLSNAVGKFVDWSDTDYDSNGEVETWRIHHALVKNPKLVRPENSRRDIFKNYLKN